ncbi:MAG: TolC family protein [Proteobacteria bacterium]|nr:TolC family protein [Pseudomonadota bacterium]
MGQIRLLSLAGLLAAASAWPAASAPEAGPAAQTLGLGAALEIADRSYPAVKAALEEKVAAASGVDAARAAYVPQVNLLWQINKSTINNMTGLLFPQGVLPSISGPVLPSQSTMAWNEGAGVLVDFTALDFGVRRARLDAAKAGAKVASQTYELTRLQVMDATANAYLNVLAAQALVRAAQSNVERLHAFRLSVKTLVDNKLRAGVEGEQAAAAESLGQTQLIAAQGQLDGQRATLAKLLGRPVEGLALSDPALDAAEGPAAAPDAAALAGHPAAQAQAAKVKEQKAELRAIDRSFAPKVDLLASASGRGSGKSATGVYQGGGAGLNIDTHNWGVGAQVTLPLGAYPLLMAQHRAQSAQVNAEQDRYDLTVRELNERLAQAGAAVRTAEATARETPLALAAARAAETQQRARYTSGLASAVDITAAEAALAQAEAQDAVARVNVWRAWSGYSVATGDFSALRAKLGQK